MCIAYSQAWWWECHGLRLHECCRCWRVIFHWRKHELQHVLWNTAAEHYPLPPHVPAWQWPQTPPRRPLLYWKPYSVFPKALAILESHHQIASCHIKDTRGGNLTPLPRCSRCILQPLPTGQYTMLNVKTVLFEAIQFRISSQFSFIWPIDRTLSGATTPGHSGPGKRWQWRGTPYSLKLQQYWSLTRLFRVILRTLVMRGV